MSARVDQPLVRGFSLRVQATDAGFVRELFGLAPGVPRAPVLPSRLVVDGHVPLQPRGADLAHIAQTAGIPFIVDPETFYLQDLQHEAASVLLSPYMTPSALTPADLIEPSALRDLTKMVVGHQLACGATAIVPPYVHIGTPDLGWAQVQASLWRYTAQYLEQEDVRLPVVAVLAVGWRCLHPTQGVPALSRLWDSLATLGPREVAIAASNVHGGKDPSDRLADLLMLVKNISQSYKVTMWQQGLFGEVCVIEGADGYECGINAREQCDLAKRATYHRHSGRGGGGGSRRFVRTLGGSVDARRLSLTTGRRDLLSHLLCMDGECCEPSRGLSSDPRRHAVIARARSLLEVRQPSIVGWQWAQAEARATDGLRVAASLNMLAPRSRDLPGVNESPLLALQRVANARRARRAHVRRPA